MEGHMGVAEDRISELPDSIFHNQILCRLQSKCAVSTSILSKRWRWLWAGVPALEFSFNSRSPSVIPQYVYSFKCLEVLKISCFLGVFELPNSVSLPFLRTLELHSMILVDEGSTQQFLSSFPALKDLSLVHCVFYNHEKLSISVPSLNRLRIVEARSFSIQYFQLYSPIIEIRAPKLADLQCWTISLPREYILLDISLLQGAWIDLEELHNPVLSAVDAWLNVCKLLDDLVHVMKLHISADLLMILPREQLLRLLPTFTNLTFLRVIKPCCVADLLSVLQLMPNLENLIVDKVKASSEDDLTFYIGEMLPQCFQSRIKEYQINYFDGSPGDLCMINFLLTNIVALQITDIIDNKDLNLDPVKMVRLGRHSSNPCHPLSLQDLLSEDVA